MKFECPVCGKRSGLVLNEEQALCTSETCNVVMFNPSLPDGGLSNVHVIEWEPPVT